MESRHTHRHKPVYTYVLVYPDTHNEHMYSYMFTNVYTLAQKPTVQHTDMYSHRHRYT